MEHTIFTNLNGHQLEVCGWFKEAREGNNHTPGLPADFEIFQILFQSVDVMPIINDVDLDRIQADCIAACENI